MKKHIEKFKSHLMSGMSYMLPLIIGASLVLAIPKIIGLLFGVVDLNVYAEAEGFYHYLYLIEQVGWTGIGLINTVLAGFIAYSIADKPAAGAGFIGGAIATNTNAGFLGAIIAAFLAGYSVKWATKNIKVSEKYQQTLPLIVFPLISTFLVAIVMGVILAGPLSAINEGLIDWIRTMVENETNSVLLAAVLGGMIASDLGGPINKAAWMTGMMLIAEGIYMPAIMVNIAICVVPLGYAFAAMIHKNKMSQELLDAGRNNFIMGFIGITEGAIPFTLVSPLRLIPINIIGGALASALGTLLGMYPKMPPVGGMYGLLVLGNAWAAYVGLFAGALFIGGLSGMLVDFSQDNQSEISEDEIEIVFE